MAQGFLLKYAEIGVKGKNRYKFEDALCDQIRLRLSGIDGDFTVQKESGRVFVQADGDFDFDEVIETLQRVFGLAGISPVEVVEDKNWDTFIWQSPRCISWKRIKRFGTPTATKSWRRLSTRSAEIRITKSSVTKVWVRWMQNSSGRRLWILSTESC